MGKGRDWGKSLVRARIYVEGGGDDDSPLRAELRQGFQKFFQKLGFSHCNVRAGGGCAETWADFEMGLADLSEDEIAFLLVDSDAHPGKQKGWEFLESRKRNKLSKPSLADEDSAYFMVVAMEAWLVADCDALQKFYGESFRRDKIANVSEVERFSKKQLKILLREATEPTLNGCYKKRHAFRILSEVDPRKVADASPHAARFMQALRDVMNV